MAAEYKNEALTQKLATMTDEEALSNLLLATTDFHDRRMIRSAIRDLRKKKLGDNGGAAPIRTVKPKKKELNLENVTDENELRKMLDETDDFEDKKMIHDAIKDLRSKARDVAGNIIMKDEDAYEEKFRKQDEEYEKHKDGPVKPSQIEMVISQDPSCQRGKDDGTVDFTTINDVAHLEKMLGEIEDFGERTQIRARIKELRDQEDLDVPDYPDARRLSEGLEAYYMDERGRRRSSLIDRAALEEMNKEAAVSAENVNYDEIEDPAELEKLLETAVDIGEKRMIRGYLKTLRDKLEADAKKANQPTKTSTTG